MLSHFPDMEAEAEREQRWLAGNHSCLTGRASARPLVGLTSEPESLFQGCQVAASFFSLRYENVFLKIASSVLEKKKMLMVVKMARKPLLSSKRS